MKKYIILITALSLTMFAGCNFSNETNIQDKINLIENSIEDFSLIENNGIEENFYANPDKIKSTEVKMFSLKKFFPFDNTSKYIDCTIIIDSLSKQDSIYYLNSQKISYFNKDGVLTSINSKNQIETWQEQKFKQNMNGDKFVSTYISYYDKNEIQIEYKYLSKYEMYKITKKTNTYLNKEILGYQTNLHGFKRKNETDTIHYKFDKSLSKLEIKNSNNLVLKKFKIVSNELEGNKKTLLFYLQEDKDWTLFKNFILENNKIIEENIEKNTQEYFPNYGTKFEFDNNGRLIKKTLNKNSKKFIITYSYKYKNDGGLIEVVTNYHNNGRKSSDFFEIKYDSHGNWIWKKFLYNGEITSRKINYYE